MIIEKNGQIFHIKEYSKSWEIHSNIDGVEVHYNVKKTDCAMFEELKKFIIENKSF